jgi:hypothetical protein
MTKAFPDDPQLSFLAAFDDDAAEKRAEELLPNAKTAGKKAALLFFQRAAAPSRAISDRCSDVSSLALALPPGFPPFSYPG